MSSGPAVEPAGGSREPGGSPREQSESRATPPARASILAEAAAIVDGARQDDYGPPERNLERIAATWSVLLADKLAPGATVDARDVALCMCALKLVREAWRPKRDSRVDLAGYAELLDRVTPDGGAGA